EVQAEGGTPPFRYSLDNELFVANSTLIALPADTYRIYVQDNNGCVVSETTTLNDPPPFTVDAGDERYTIVLGDSIALEATVDNAVGQVDFLWQEPYEGTLSCLACIRTVSQPEYSILYKLFAEDERGCRASDMVRVIVDKPRVVEVPTGFTPNGDGTNDRLLVHGQSPTVVNRFQVFDRWGELLYQARDFAVNDPDVGWDGIYRGKPVDPGVYIWYLEVTYRDGQQAAFQGQTTLIR
ncbi:MAG TPA: gliding motility-associated C-terminal domain-containing protein, partial [Phaeodactylibacter sp.]|nr:gliding motility-associated C-terminal domain-containing protein [Phaeodactylibacter sp.]